VAWIAGLGFEATSIGVEMRAPRACTPPAAVPDLITDQFDVLRAAAIGCDIVLGAGLHQYAARSVAEQRGARYVVAAYCPASIPSADTPPPGTASEVDDPAEMCRLWAATKRVWNDRSLDRVNAHRAKLGLGPVSDVLAYILGERPWLACDKVLGPVPMSSDLEVLQTGAWLLPDRGALPAELERFLEAGRHRSTLDSGACRRLQPRAKS
jgi:vancomycin aglycone glucosyltransferase